MIARLHGTVYSVDEFSAVVMVGGVGYMVTIPDCAKVILGSVIELVVYHHWVAEKGPSLFGFFSESEKQLFLALISVPKIGPSIAVSLMAQGGLAGLCDIILSQSSDRLSSFSGIGPKKANQIIASLYDVVQKLVSTGKISIDTESSGGALYDVQEALKNLTYSPTEIKNAVRYLNDKYGKDSVGVDVLLRSALSFLAK